MKKKTKEDKAKEAICVNIANHMLKAIKDIEAALNDPKRYDEIKDGMSIPVGSIGTEKENGFVLCVGIVPAAMMEIAGKEQKSIEVVERPKLILVNHQW
jgi:hypothetical protein